MCISSYAQTDSLSRKQRAAEWFYKVEAYLKKSALSKVDTNYLGLPEHGWGVSLNTNIGQSYMHTTGKNFDILGNPDMRLRSAINARLGGSIGYQTLRISFSYDLNKGYSSQLRFNIMQNAWGIDVHWHNNSSLHGIISSPLIETTDINKGNILTNDFALTTYYVFNYRRFSLPAAITQSYIQRRSAGSAIIHAKFTNTETTYDNLLIEIANAGIKQIKLYQASIGIGYGYNYTPNNGKFLFHISAAPVLVFINRGLITADTYIMLKDSSIHYIEVQREIKPRVPVYVTGTARLAAVYYINQRFVLAFNANFNNIRFSSDNNIIKPIETSANIDEMWRGEQASLKMNNISWNATITFGVRFGLLKKRPQEDWKYGNITFWDLFKKQK
ncbi:MAG: DUF4421 family protein [Paludibacteraceae bacterium]|nr:DUF4421 family protein [Paludibacteraceae bacterium]